MTKEREITGWWSFLIAVIFKPTWEFLTASVLFLSLATATWFRDNFASDEWKRKLELKGFLPNMHPAWWLCIGLLVLIFLIVRESYRLWAELRVVEKPRPNLRVTGYNNVQRDWRVMWKSGQVDKLNKSGSAYEFQLWIENTPLEDQLGIAAEKVVAQITFNKDGKPLFVADGWWPEKIINAEEESIRYHKQKDIGAGATEYLEIAFKFHWSSAAYGLNDGSRSCEEWSNPALKLEPGSYSASVRLVGPNVNTTRTIEFTNSGPAHAFTLDSL